MIGAKFGSFSVQDPASGVWLVSVDVFSSPENQIQADALPEADGSLIVQQRFGSKTFTASGRLRSTTRAGLEALMDTFKLAMSQKNQPFDIDFGGGVRRYLANAQNVTISDNGLTTAGYSVQFLSPDGMGWDTNSSALVTPTGITTSTSLIAMTVGGTYKAEPIITVVLNTVTASGSQTISISNSTTLRGMTITRTWAAGDLLEINSLSKTVYVNSVATNFTGQFPTWESGTGGLQYTDVFSARDVTLTASYTKRYL